MSDLLKKNKEATHVSVRIGMPNYEIIQKYCQEQNYKIGKFIEKCAITEVERKAKKVKA